MGRKPKIRSTPEEPKEATFLSALKYIGLITKDIGIPAETHVHLQSYWATASNGVLAVGHPIREDLYCCPQNTLLIEALSKSKEHFSLTQLDPNRLAITSGKFRAVIPCIDPALINVIGPDAPIAVIDNRLKEAFDVVGILASEHGQEIYNSSILLNGTSVISTNGKVVIEYWHGIDLPPELPIPKALIGPLSKINKNLTGFGFSQSSITFWYEDQSWIKSQLYAEPWPDVAALLNRDCNPFPVPQDFFVALDAIRGFTESGNVFFDRDCLRSHPTDQQGAQHECAGLPKGPIFNAKQLAMLKPLATSIDFLVPVQGGNVLMFYGKNVRGIISGIITT